MTPPGPAPRLKAHLAAVPRAGEGVLLVSETRRHVLHGAPYAEVVPLIDGARDAAAITAALDGRVEAAMVAEVLARLDRAGHLAAATPSDAPRAEAAFWEAQDKAPAEARAALAAGRVALRPLGGIDPAPMAEALARLGIAVATDDAAPTALTIAMAASYLDPTLAMLAAEGGDLLLLRPVGLEVWIGPLIRPGATPPLPALTERLAAHSLAHRLAGDAAAAEPARAALPASLRLACEAAALEVARLLAGLPTRLLGTVLSIDTISWTSRLHALLPLPAADKPAEPEPPVLRPTPVASRDDHGHRSVAAEQTLARYEHLVSPITGLVPAVVAVSAPGQPFPVFAAGHNAASRVRHLRDLRQTLRFNASGKGASAAQSRASALCEALERVSAVFRPDMPHEVASLNAMRDRHGAAAIHPNAVMRVSDTQYALREVWNATASAFHRVPHRLPPDLPIHWSPLWSLTAHAWRWLPTQLVALHAPAGPGLAEEYAVGCGNGHAAGNTREEAILQGLCELVERDATAIWWYNRLRRPAVDPLAFGDATTAALIAAEAGRRRLWALDLTSDIGIPVYCALGAADDAAGSAPLFGLGCHPDPRIALQRAFGEWQQLSVSAAGLAAAPRDAAPEMVDWLRNADCDRHPYLRGHADAPAAPPPALVPSGDLKTDIEACVALLAAKGLEVLVMEQTHPAIGLPVVKVVVPGLRHFWARFAPGRLYDVPVAMGWRAERLREADLNPIPVFI